MTDNYELVGSIRRSLADIRRHYDMALIPSRLTGGVKMPTQAVEGDKMKYAGKAMEHSPAPTDLGVVQERINTHSDLSHFCRVILFEVTDINGGTIQTKLNPADPLGLASFIDTWAERMAEQVPLEAERAEADLRKHAEALERMAYRDRRDWMRIGDCPVTVADPDGNSVVCGADVRAYTEKRFIRCQGCGTEDTLAWWMSQIVPEGADLAIADSVIACVEMRTLRPLSHDRLRQWATRGFVQRHGKDMKGRTLYSTAAVLAYAQDQSREEVA